MGGGKKARGKSAPPARSKKGKSGNPAKRAEQERLAGQRASGVAPRAAQGSAFGLGSPPAAQPASADLELPAGLEKFLGR